MGRVLRCVTGRFAGWSVTIVRRKSGSGKQSTATAASPQAKAPAAAENFTAGGRGMSGSWPPARETRQGDRCQTSSMGVHQAPPSRAESDSWHGSVKAHQRCVSGSAAMRA